MESKIQEGVRPAQGGQRLIASIGEKCSSRLPLGGPGMDDVLGLWDEGRKIEYVHKHLVGLPKKPHDLYADILDPLTEEENELAMQLFYWAILTTKPLRLRGWRHIMSFIKRPVLLSLRKWRLSDELTEDDEQLIKQIRYVSRGLVEGEIPGGRNGR